MSREEIIDKLHAILTDHIGLQMIREALVEESHLVVDLSLDSIDLVEFVMAIEDRFDLDIDHETTESWRTIGDVAGWLESATT